MGRRAVDGGPQLLAEARLYVYTFPLSQCGAAQWTSQWTQSAPQSNGTPVLCTSGIFRQVYRSTRVYAVAAAFCQCLMMRAAAAEQCLAASDTKQSIIERGLVN